MGDCIVTKLGCWYSQNEACMPDGVIMGSDVFCYRTGRITYLWMVGDVGALEILGGIRQMMVLGLKSFINSYAPAAAGPFLGYQPTSRTGFGTTGSFGISPWCLSYFFPVL